MLTILLLAASGLTQFQVGDASGQDALNPGSGAWSTRIIDSNIAGIDQLECGDIDRDGRLDVVASVLEGEEGKLLWYHLGSGGTLLGTRVIGLGLPKDFVLHDLDGDKDLDIIFLDDKVGSLRWLECPRDPFATSEPWQWWSIDDDLPDARALTVGDLDRDGHSEVVVTGQGNNATIWFSPDLEFKEWGRHLIDDSTPRPTDCLSIDINLDGNLDVVVVTETGTVVWFENLDLENWAKHPVGTTDGSLGVLAAGDIYQNGIPEIVCGSMDRAELYMFRASEDPSKSWSKEFLNPGGNGLTGLRLIDLNEDGDRDIVFIAKDLGVGWFRNFESDFQKFDIAGHPGIPGGVAVGDMDLDGDLDLAVAERTDGKLLFHFSGNHGYLGKNSVYHPTFVEELPAGSYMAVGCLNRDPYPDILTAGEQLVILEMGAEANSPKVRILEDNGTIFGQPHLEDMDGDTDLDILLRGNDTLYLFSNLDGTGGSWAPTAIRQGLPENLSFMPLDVDRNSYMDVMVSGDAGFYWLEHRQGSNWQKHTITEVEAGVLPLISDDFDLDSYPDVVGMNDSSIVWYQNPGGEDEGPWIEHTLNQGTEPAWLFPFDAQGNGSIDLLFENVEGQDHKIFRNPSDTRPWGERPVDLPYKMLPLASLDMDENGNSDLFVSLPNLEGMALLFQLDNGDFLFSSVYTPSTPLAAVLTDMDCDGDPDIVIHAANGKLMVYSNEILLISAVDFQERSLELVNPSGPLSLQGYSLLLGEQNIELPQVDLPARKSITIKDGEDGGLSIGSEGHLILTMPLSSQPSGDYGELGIYYTQPGSGEEQLVDFLVWAQNESWDRPHGKAYLDALESKLWKIGQRVAIWGHEEVMIRKPLLLDTNKPGDFYLWPREAQEDIDLVDVSLILEGPVPGDTKGEGNISILVRLRNDSPWIYQGRLRIYLAKALPEQELGNQSITLPQSFTSNHTILWKPTPAPGQYELRVILEDEEGEVLVNEIWTVTVPSSANGDGTTPLPFNTPFAHATVALVATLVLAYLISTESFRLQFYSLLVPLYTRITKRDVEKDIEEQNFRGRIYQYIHDNPGTHYSEIRKAVGLGNGQLAHHLEMLESLVFIKSRHNGRHRIFCIRGGNFPSKEEKPIKLSKTQQHIMLALQEQKPMTIKALRERLREKISQQAVSANIKVLEFYGIVRGEKKGIRKYLRLAGPLGWDGEFIKVVDERGVSRSFYFG